MRRWLLRLLIFLGVIFVACAPSEPETDPDAETATPVLLEEQSQASLTEEAAASAVLSLPAATAEIASAPAIGEPPTAGATEPEAAETAEPQRNGVYEGTYFRGLASAPVTMIDYSDFL